MPSRLQPTDPDLYAAMKRAAKQKFTVWPSVYASAWLVKQYKDAGGRFEGERSEHSRLKHNIRHNNAGMDTRYWPSRADVQSPIVPMSKTLPVTRAK